MMSGDDLKGGVSKTRGVLEDLTNRPAKRGYSLISSDLGLKPIDGYDKKVVSEDGDLRFAKQVCLGVSNLVKEKCEAKLALDVNKEKGGLFVVTDKQALCSSPKNVNIDASQENIVSILSYGQNETQEASECLGASFDYTKSGATTQNTGEAGDATRDGCASGASMAASSGPCKKDSDDEGILNSGVAESNLVGQGSVGGACTGDDENHGIGSFPGSKCGSIEGLSLCKVQSSKSFELSKCTGLNADTCVDQNSGADLLNSCSCSFCLKAAYIWSDLHYQDIKGRIAALKKSQKEASILVNKYTKGKQNDIHVQGTSSKSSKLESDLTGSQLYHTERFKGELQDRPGEDHWHAFRKVLVHPMRLMLVNLSCYARFNGNALQTHLSVRAKALVAGLRQLLKMLFEACSIIISMCLCYSCYWHEQN